MLSCGSEAEYEGAAAPLIDRVTNEACELGFDWAAFIQLRGIGPVAGVACDTCPGDCAAYQSSVPCRADPVWGHAQATILPFLWEDQDSEQQPSCALEKLRRDCSPRRLSGGSIPIHGPLGAIACLHVGSYGGNRSFRRHFKAMAAKLHEIGQSAQQALVELELNARRKDPRAITPRQAQVLPWLMRGKTNWEIGKILGITEDTVRQHVIAIMRALGASNRTEAAAMAAWNGLAE